MIRRLRTAALLAMVVWTWIAPDRVLAQILPPPPTGSLIVTVTSPTSGSTVSGTVPVSASVSIAGSLTVAGVQFKLDGANLGGEDTSSPYSVSWNTTTASNGSHTLTAVARDQLGVLWTSNPVTVTVFNDTTAPSVSITSPASGASVSGTISVTASASDNVGVVGVQFLLDGANAGAEVTAAPYSVSWNTTTASNASHTITAVARDAAGNRTTSAPVTVTVFNDTTPPTVSITSPVSGASVSGTISVTASASDNVGVAGVQFKLDGANAGAEVTAAPYSVSWNTTTASNASHTLTAVARDAAGNRTTSAPVTVTVDNVAPTVTINQAATQADPTNSSPINFTVVFSKPVSGFTGTGVTLSGTAGGAKTVAVSGGPSTYTAAVSGMTTAGTVIATIAAGVARDAAGNPNTASTSTDNSVSFDATAPTVSITSPASGASVSGTITVSANASDNVGVAGVQFLLDGVNGVEVTAAPYSISWNTTTASNASHTITAVARDAAGNRTTSAPVTVTVFNDTTPPTVSITSPASGSTVSGTITVTASASDNVGVAGVQFKLDGLNADAEVTTSPYSVSWNTTSSSNASHTITAVARDAAGNRATSAGVTVTVSNGTATVTRFEENSAAVSPTGSWVRRGPEVAAFSGGTAGSSDVSGATVTLSFTGTAVSWIGLRCSVCGIATVSIDGGAATSVDTAGPAAPGTPGLTSEVVFTASSLAAGSHTLVITVTGTTTSGGAHIIIDAFDATGTGSATNRFEENSPAVSPTGAWVRRGPEVAAFSGGTAGSSDVSGATVTFSFTGTAVNWIGLKCSVCGIATVSIDGGAANSVNSAGPAAAGSPGLTSEPVFTASGLAAGAHSLVITVTGTTTSAGAHILVDAFDVTPP